MNIDMPSVNPLADRTLVGSYPASKGGSTGDGKKAESAIAGRVRRRSTSSRSSRSMKSVRRSLSRSTRSSPSDRYYRRSRYRHSRSRNRSRTRSRSRSSPYRRRRRSSRTPSYRPLLRRRLYGRPRRFSPPPRRGGGGGGRGGPSNTSIFARSPVHAKPSSRTRPARSPLMQRSRPANSPPPTPMPPLSERFEALVRSTLRQGRREYGVLGGLAHLILTNRPKLPLPTLMREAKELSVVIDRNLPLEIADPNAEISFNLDFGTKFIIPFSRNTGTKPVFDRPEVPVYKTIEDEKKIIERIAAALAAEAAENQPGPRRSSGAFPNPTNNSFLSEKADRSKRGSAFSRLGPSNPLEVPKGSAYFMHDDRDEPFYGNRGRNPGDASYSRRRRNDYNDYSSSRRRRNDRESRWGVDRSTQKAQLSGAIDDGQWCHDKFLELEEGEKGEGAKNGRRSRRSSHASESPNNHRSGAN